MSSLWFWTPLLWKALRFIVLFNYEILSSVIHCDSVTDSTWLRRDCPDWITGRTEPAEPHACEPWRSTSSLRRAPRGHPGGDRSSFHSSAPLLPGTASSPLWPPPRWPPLQPFPSPRPTNLWWYLLLDLAHPGCVVGMHWATSNVNTVQIQHQYPAIWARGGTGHAHTHHWVVVATHKLMCRTRRAMATLAPRTGWEAW